MIKIFVPAESQHLVPPLALHFDIEPAEHLADVVLQHFECHQWSGFQSRRPGRLHFLICHELEPPIMSLLPDIDQPGVILLHTGAIDHEPRYMHMVRFENFFYEISNLHRFVPGCDVLIDSLHTDQIKPRTFDALIGRTNPVAKPHRVFLRDLLEQADPAHFFVSAFGSQDQQEWSDSYAWPQGVKLQPTDNTLRSQMMIDWYGQRTYLSHAIPDAVYRETAYSIVSETYHDDRWSFFTEKTAKPLWCGRLFVMFAGAHYLQRLKDIGFRTFDCVIDESYDAESDPQQRWSRAWQQVQWLCQQDQRQILQQIKAVTDHNRAWLLTQDWSATSAIKRYLDLC